jgi:hypothetical protein
MGGNKVRGYNQNKKWLVYSSRYAHSLYQRVKLFVLCLNRQSRRLKQSQDKIRLCGRHKALSEPVLKFIGVYGRRAAFKWTVSIQRDDILRWPLTEKHRIRKFTVERDCSKKYGLSRWSCIILRRLVQDNT